MQMFERHYYCLIAGLPDLVLNDKKSLPFQDVREMLNRDLHPSDRVLCDQLCLPFDHLNIVNALFHPEKAFHPMALFHKELIDLLIDKKEIENPLRQAFPDYIQSTLDQWFTATDPMHEKQVIMALQNGYYRMLSQSSNAFMNNWSEFDSNLRNVMAALNGRKYNLAFDDDLIGDNEITEALKKNRSRDFGLSSLIPGLDAWIQLHENTNLVDRELQLDTLRWKFIDDATFFNYFTIEKVLAFLLKIMIIERWMVLDSARGRELFNRLLQELQAGYEIPDEFKVRHGK
ncbi:uncharacterized protein DUF2764 [Breznakibacter xylanolyticus]|uniref:Uncharacterized protein DUF2764 n=1 Tax=Breznakibacter xylanolyticus TaxID=990 RepID=A0A2W7NK62_9BACT|nr:DUF2764 family protein [Breznakibacter xylanolyticus]PZX13576.1 uncharacterized protein DUF2764 [Breznakibacter xylanolyticus]